MGSDPRELTVVGEKVFFLADDAVHGSELWMSDGTESGTRMVVDWTPGSESTVFNCLEAQDEWLFFCVAGPNGTSAWACDAGEVEIHWLSDSVSTSQRFAFHGAPLFHRLPRGWLYPAHDWRRGTEPWLLPSGPGPRRFRRGDVDPDGEINIADPIALLRPLFLGGEVPQCLDAADTDDNGSVELTDAIRLLDWLFRSGKPLPFPGSKLCAHDPTADLLLDCSYPEDSCP